MSTVHNLAAKTLLFASLAIGLAAPADARTYVKTDAAQRNAFSISVATEGGKVIWLGGQTGSHDDNNHSLAGDFESQARQVIKRLTQTMEKNGGKLSDIVNMTVAYRLVIFDHEYAL